VCVHKSGPAFARASGSTIVAVSKRTPGAAAAFAARLPGGGAGVAAYTDAASLFADAAVDAVYIATPPGAHAALTAAAAAAGKAVYVEKPMARCGAEAAAMAASVGGGRLAIAYYRRSLAKYVWVRSLLVGPTAAGTLPAGGVVTPSSAPVPAAGCLGTLTGVTYTYVGNHPAGGVGWRDDPPVSGGGMMLDVGVHVVNLLQQWFGEDPTVEGTPEATADPASGVEATVAFRLRFPPGGCAAAAGGVAADFSFDFCAGAAARKVDELVLTGTAASARLSVLGVPGAVTVTPADGGAPTAVSFPAPAHVQQPLIQAVVDEWTGGAGAPRQPSPAGPAVRTSELVDEVLRGVYGPRGMGFWETWTKPVGGGQARERGPVPLFSYPSFPLFRLLPPWGVELDAAGSGDVIGAVRVAMSHRFEGII